MFYLIKKSPQTVHKKEKHTYSYIWVIGILSPYNHKSFIECSVFVLVSLYLIDLSKMNEKGKYKYKIKIMQCPKVVFV